MKTDIPAPPGTHTRGETQIPVLELLSVQPPDLTDGWRLIYTRKASSSVSVEYRTAHARAQRIRQGKVTYLSGYGVWDARVRWVDQRTVGLYVRYCGADGMRWA